MTTIPIKAKTKTKTILAFLRCLLPIVLLVACSGKSNTSDHQSYGPEEVAERRATLEQIIVEREQDADTDGMSALRQSLLEYERSTENLEKSIPELTKDKDYYRLQCEYLDAIIKLARRAELQPEENLEVKITESVSPEESNP